MHQSIRNARFSDHTRVKWWKNPAKRNLWRWNSCELDALWFSANRSTHDNSVHHCLTSAQKSPWLYQWGEGSSLAPYLHCWNSVTNNTMRTQESHRTLVACRLYTVQSSSLTEHVCEKLNFDPTYSSNLLKSTSHCITVLLFFGATWIMYRSYSSCNITIRIQNSLRVLFHWWYNATEGGKGAIRPKLNM